MGCSKNQESLATDNGAIRSNANTTVYAGTVSMQNSTFNPTELLIAETGTVLWLNKDNMVHTVTADNGAFDSGDIPAGGSYTYTFNVRGLYTYKCKYHPEMYGSVRAMVK